MALTSETTGSTVIELIGRRDAHPALVSSEGCSVTYAEMHDAVWRVAAELRSAGLREGDAVAFALTNSPSFVVALLAGFASGVAAAPLNPAYTAHEFRSYLEILRPRAMVLDRGGGAAARRVCHELGIATLDLVGDSGREISLGVEAAGHPDGAGSEAVALLLHTSGTTSRPKCVPLRQRNLAASTRAIAATYDLSGDDVSLCVMPLFHVHGLVASTLATLHSGGTVVVPPRFSATTFWNEVVGHRVSWYSAVPTIHHVLCTRAGADPPPPHSLRFARSCSAALPPLLQARVEAVLDIPLVQAYGMTEASHQIASNPLPPYERRPGSVGRSTGIDVAVVNDGWRQLPAGEHGEVAIRGASVIDGYRGNPEANAAAFRDGWFLTGDRGCLSHDGYLTLDGRIKELINRGGEKISPHEIEDVLLAHGAVSDAVAYAVPDAKYGEQVAAAVVVNAATAPRELAAHCAKHLAPFKVPTSIALVPEIPKGPTGKVQRALLGEIVPFRRLVPERGG